MSITENTTTAQDETQAALQVAETLQARMTALSAEVRDCGPQDDSVITPLLVKRLAIVRKNLTLGGNLSVREANAKDKAAAAAQGVTCPRFVHFRYMTPEQDEAWRTLAGNTTSLHKARAAAAVALGFTQEDVADLLAIGATRKGKATQDLLAWTRAYAKLTA